MFSGRSAKHDMTWLNNTADAVLVTSTHFSGFRQCLTLILRTFLRTQTHVSVLTACLSDWQSGHTAHVSVLDT